MMDNYAMDAMISYKKTATQLCALASRQSAKSTIFFVSQTDETLKWRPSKRADENQAQLELYQILKDIAL